MSQLKILGFILLLVFTIPLLSMSEVNQVKNVSSPLDAIVPTIEATIMTTLATLPQAMMYIPFKEAIAFTIHSGIITGCISALGYALPSLLLGGVLGSDRPNYSVKSSVIEWRKPLSVSLALLTTCFMLSLNHRELTNNYGI